MVHLAEFVQGLSPASHASDDQGVARDLDAAARALASLLSRDDGHPIRWSTPSFVSEVATNRSLLSMVLTMDELVMARRRLLADDPITTSGRDVAALRLGRDPAAVAFALRTLEIERQVRLAPWPDLLRRREILSVETDPTLGAATWFG